MKKIILSIAVLLISIAALVSCSEIPDEVEESFKPNTEADNGDNWVAPDIVKVGNEVAYLEQNSVNVNKLNYKNKFVYTGTDKYLKVITEDLVKMSDEFFDVESKQTVEIPTPYIVKIDDSDKNDIKVYGNFYIYGYNLNGVTFECQNSGSFPGCYHLKEENDVVSFVSKEFAEDGSNNYSSLVKICNNDEELVKKIFAAHDDDSEHNTRIEYIKMYANNNQLSVNSIKDYGWPVIIFDDVNSIEFVFTFYKYYMLEIKQEDSLADMPERIENLKSKYMTKEAIDRVDEASDEIGADQIIDAQDVTDDMYDSLKVTELDDGTFVVTMDERPDFHDKIEVKTNTIDGKLKITDIKVVRPEPIN